MNLTTSDSAITTLIDALSDKMNPDRIYASEQALLRWRNDGFIGFTPEQKERVLQAIKDHGLS